MIKEENCSSRSKYGISISHSRNNEKPLTLQRKLDKIGRMNMLNSLTTVNEDYLPASRSHKLRCRLLASVPQAGGAEASEPLLCLPL